MHFFLQFADFFALFLVFFGLAFFLLRRFFMWYLGLPVMQNSIDTLSEEIAALSKQVSGLQAVILQQNLEEPSLEASNTEKLKQVAQETLVDTVKPKLEQDFRVSHPKIKAEVSRRRDLGLCIYCGEKAMSGQLYCSTSHHEEYFKGNQVEPINLPFPVDPTMNA